MSCVRKVQHLHLESTPRFIEKLDSEVSDFSELFKSVKTAVEVTTWLYPALNFMEKFVLVNGPEYLNISIKFKF